MPRWERLTRHRLQRLRSVVEHSSTMREQGQWILPISTALDERSPAIELEKACKESYEMHQRRKLVRDMVVIHRSDI